MAQCPTCHASAPAMARFCPRCGHRVRGSAMLWTGVVIGVVILLFVALAVVAAPSPTATVPDAVMDAHFQPADAIQAVPAER